MFSVAIQGSLASLMFFMLISSITPGPNNLMLLHGSIQRGFWACRWHIVGISTGLGVMLTASYFGMAAIITEHAFVLLAIKIFGTAYLLWLTLQMARQNLTDTVRNALADQSTAGTALPLSFWQAVCFQWLNPKGWTMVMLAPSLLLMTVSTGTLSAGSVGAALGIGLIVLLCMAVNILCISCWAGGGERLRALIHRPRLMQVLHWLIIGLTVYCAASFWL